MRPTEVRPDIYSFAAAHGRRMVATDPLPEGVRLGRRGNCFLTAFQLAAERGWLYVEGYGMDAGEAWIHAWCLDGAGRVMDPTWPFEPGREYMGVAMTVETAARVICSAGPSGILDPLLWCARVLDGLAIDTRENVLPPIAARNRLRARRLRDAAEAVTELTGIDDRNLYVVRDALLAKALLAERGE